MKPSFEPLELASLFSMNIGQLAKKSQVSVETLRYYEKQGLLPEPPRTEAGYRQYPSDTVDRVAFVKHAQDLGFFLKEIRELLSLQDTSDTTCRDVQARAHQKLKVVEEKIAALQKIKEILQKLVVSCDGDSRSSETCVILNAIQSGIPEEVL